jgi:isopentenyl-diphosphate delta-isomerase
MSKTSSRKQEHVEAVLHQNVLFKRKTAGFEQWDFVHNALPELNFADIDTSITFLGKRLSLPLMISCMTGGYKDAERINRGLAEVCEEKRIAMGVGSQRQAMEDETFHRSFSVAREAAPSIPFVSNIGAAEVAKKPNLTKLRRIIDLIQADALAVHLNPLQELLQPEGSPNFRGVLAGIERLEKSLGVPIIVKEVGAGISADVARRLLNVGVHIIDVAGAGGTSWAGVEILRSNNGSATQKKF